MALIASIAFDPDRNLGRAYNDVMLRLRRDDWAVFIDHDAMWTTRHWFAQLQGVIASYDDVGLITAMTNRIGNKRQIPKGAPTGHDMREHRAFGDELVRCHGCELVDVTKGPLSSGVVLCLSRKVWDEIGGFKDGFFGVDNRVHQDVAAAGRRVGLMPGLYVYHWYRADGVGHRDAPKAKLL